MGLFGKLLKGPQVDMDKSNADRVKMRAMFDRMADNGANYSILFGYTKDAGRYNYGIVHGSKTKIGNFIVGWNETAETVVVLPTVPDLSGCDEPIYYRRNEILKAYQNRYPTDAFIIYSDRKSYIGIHVWDWLEDEKLYIFHRNLKLRS